MLMQEAVLKMKKKKCLLRCSWKDSFSNHLILHAAALAIGASQ